MNFRLEEPKDWREVENLTRRNILPAGRLDAQPEAFAAYEAGFQPK